MEVRTNLWSLSRELQFMLTRSISAKLLAEAERRAYKKLVYRRPSPSIVASHNPMQSGSMHNIQSTVEDIIARLVRSTFTRQRSCHVGVLTYRRCYTASKGEKPSASRERGHGFRTRLSVSYRYRKWSSRSQLSTLKLLNNRHVYCRSRRPFMLLLQNCAPPFKRKPKFQTTI